MKKKSLILLVLCSMLILSSMVFAQAEIKVYVNGKKVDFPDASPYVTDGRTLVPVRFIAESLGAKVDWSHPKQEVTITKGSEKIVLKIGEKKATVGSKVIELDTNAIIKDTRTFVPLRFISETLNAKVEWEGSTSTVTITTEDNKNIVVKTISEVIKNKEVMHSDIIKNVKFVDKDKYKFKLEKFEDSLFIESDVNAYGMLFIKNGKIEHQTFPMPSIDKVYYPINFELRGIDFIGIYNFRTDTMEIMENVFK